MRAILWLAYTGTSYHGWQVQPNAPTIQAEIQRAAQDLLSQPVSVCGCSRTDAGVHANEYCAHIEAERINIPIEKLHDALNVRLPYDIVVKRAQTAPEGFHARYSVADKEYVYLIENSPTRNPFTHMRALHYKHPLDAEKMREAAYHLEGEHDFSAFRALGSTDTIPVREVKYIRIIREDALIKIYICADGFLYNMARIIAGTLLYAGSGKIDPAGIPAIIESRDRTRAGITLPPHGLYLNKVNIK